MKVLIGNIRPVAPAMEVGVEYETGEYWMSKPIYRKLIRADELPEDTRTQIDIGTENIEHAFVDLASSWVGYENDPGTNYATDLAAVPSICVSGGAVLIALAVSFDNVTAIVSVKYTKTTD